MPLEDIASATGPPDEGDRPAEQGGSRRRNSLYDPERRGIVDTMLAQGFSLRAIGAAAGVSHEAIRLYARRSGQEGKYQEGKEERALEPERKRAEVRKLIKVLRHQALQAAHEESWAEGKAEEYAQSLLVRADSANLIPRENLVSLFETYAGARARGERASLAELGAAAGIDTGYVGMILKRVGVPSLYWNNEYRSRKRFPPTERLIAMAELGMSISDIAHFSTPEDNPLSAEAVYHRFRNAGYAPRRKDARPLRGYNDRLASEVYEAHDLGFERGEIADLLGAPVRLVDHALGRREETGARIAAALRQVHPEREQDVPYKLTGE